MTARYAEIRDALTDRLTKTILEQWNKNKTPILTAASVGIGALTGWGFGSWYGSYHPNFDTVEGIQAKAFAVDSLYRTLKPSLEKRDKSAILRNMTFRYENNGWEHSVTISDLQPIEVNDGKLCVLGDAKIQWVIKDNPQRGPIVYEGLISTCSHK